MSMMISAAGWLLQKVGERVVERLVDRGFDKVGLFKGTCTSCSHSTQFEIQERATQNLTCPHCHNTGAVYIESLDTLTVHSVIQANITVQSANIIVQQANPVYQNQPEQGEGIQPTLPMKSDIDWKVLAGQWIWDREKATYLRADHPESRWAYGEIVSNIPFRYGVIRAKARFHHPADKVTCGRIIFGYEEDTRNHFSAGLGGHGYLYTFYNFVSTVGWDCVYYSGAETDIVPYKDYRFEIDVDRRGFKLLVDGILRLSESFNSSRYNREYRGGLIGFHTWNVHKVEFWDLEVKEDPFR